MTLAEVLLAYAIVVIGVLIYAFTAVLRYTVRGDRHA